MAPPPSLLRLKSSEDSCGKFIVQFAGKLPERLFPLMSSVCSVAHIFGSDHDPGSTPLHFRSRTFHQLITQCMEEMAVSASTRCGTAVC